MFDGDDADANYQTKIGLFQNICFKNYNLVRNPMVYEFSDIDTTEQHGKGAFTMDKDYFYFNGIFGKMDPNSTMLPNVGTMPKSKALN